MKLSIIICLLFFSNIYIFGQKKQSHLELYRPDFVGKIRSIIEIIQRDSYNEENSNWINGIKEYKYIRFDEFGNITVNQSIEPYNEGGDWYIDTSEITNQIEYVYDNQENIVSIFETKGYKSEIHYDLHGNQVEEINYDSFGVKQSHIKNKIEYDTKGNRIVTSATWELAYPETDLKLKKSWRLIYDKDENILKKQKLDSMGFPYENEYQWFYDPNKVCSEYKEYELHHGYCKINNKTTRSKNQLRLLVREDKKSLNKNGDVNKTASYFYNYGNILTSSNCIADAKVIGIDSSIIHYKYKYFDNGKIKEKYMYKNNTLSEYWEFEYDENGRVLKSFMFDKERQYDWQILEVVKTIEIKYDERGSKIEEKIESVDKSNLCYKYIITYY
jgi:hypothetical protein